MITKSKIPTYDKIHLKFKLNGRYYDTEDLKEVAYSFIKEGDVFEKNLGDFLQAWLDNKDYVTVRTSGSVGEPKWVKLKKQAMVNSAIATGNAFKLEPGDKVLHCLPTNFISGRMMLVRAMILGLNLDVVPPRATPVFDEEKVYDFSAMIPLQVENILPKLDHFKTIIIGGAAVSDTLLEALSKVKTKCYATYGMTETVSHIAIKPLNGPKKSNNFKVLPKVKVSQSENGCLRIDAPHLIDEPLQTNDVVTMHSDTEFEWLGRVDNVVNSGGLKVFPEQLETLLASKMKERFFISSEEDETLGERLILVVEGEEKAIDPKIFEVLEKNTRPKQIYFIDKFVETPTRKIRRKLTLDLLKSKV
ncbi:AMP-binding protein [Formosa sp. S-31]|uniref:AMP-binding protein n=1 Tax=Formosa sp. S-31 TaxID=2790949 RepID=UPI003EBF8939